MENFSVFSYQKKGYHEFCNDYFEVFSNKDSVLVLMADGHGGEEYCRSSFGARLATYLGKKLISDQGIDDKSFPEFFKDRFDRFVRRHLSNHPLDSDELKLIGNNPHSDAYGTTFMAIYMHNGKTIGFHLGDGEIHIVDKKGNFIPFLESDNDCYLNITSSLCQDRDYVIKHFRTAVLDDLPSCIAIYTDGYKTSSPRPYEAVSLISDENYDEKLVTLLDNHKTSDDLSFVLLHDSELLKSEEYKAALNDTIKTFAELEKAEKQKERLMEEYLGLECFIQRGLEKANTLRASGNEESLRTFLLKIRPQFERFKELINLLNF